MSRSKSWSSILLLMLLCCTHLANGQGSATLDVCAEWFTRPFQSLTNPSVQESLQANSLLLDRIENGSGQYHYDLHELTVQLPASISPAGVLQDMAYNLNGYINAPGFNQYVTQISRNKSGVPRVGDVYDVDLSFSFGDITPENAVVMLSELTQDHYTLITLEDPNASITSDFFDDHPTPGVREYGYRSNPDGSYTFYTSGASRVGGPISSVMMDVQSIQNTAWQEMMKGLGRKFESLGGTILQAPTMKELKLDEAAPCGGSLDIIFLIDTTGSMADDIDRVKAEALTIISQVSSSSSSWQIAVATFRDHPVSPYGDPGDYVFRQEVGFSSDANQISSAIRGIEVAGGGDQPEAVCSALQEAIAFPWRSASRRIIILMGDAPPHDPEPISGCRIQSVMEQAYAGDREHVYPILISSDTSAASAFAQLADSSSGRVFSAETADEVVPAVLSTIDYASGSELLAGGSALVSVDTVLNLRAGPGTTFEILEEMPSGTTVTLGEGVEFVYPYIWHELTTDTGRSGWAVEGAEGQATLIPVTPEELIAATTGPCLLSPGDYRVNLRVGPGTGTGVIRKLAPGEVVEAIGQTRSAVGFLWWKIRGGGWIRDDAIGRTGACLALPAATP